MKQLGSRTMALAFTAFVFVLCAGAWQNGLAVPEASPPRVGDFKSEYKDPKSGQLIMRYRMRAPEKLPTEKKLGLIVAFHGLHSDEDSLTGFAIDTARRLQIADDYVIMGGKSKGEGWDTTDDKNALAWITWVRDTYPIDPRRVHIVGMSNGGAMVNRFGWANQDLFASVSSYCGASSEFSGAVKSPKGLPTRGGGSPADTKTEWYIVHGDADTVVPVDVSRTAVKQLTAKGYRCVYREIDGADHVGVVRVPEVADDNFRFLNSLRHKEIPLTKEERASLSSITSKLKSESSQGAALLIAEAVRLGGAAGAVAIKSALGNSDAAVKKAAIEAAETTRFDREIGMELIKLTKDKSPDIRAAAFKSLATLAGWKDAAAQEILLQAARKSSLPLEDRIAAIQGLGKMFRFMLLGWYEEKDVPWTLVLLLDDKELKVREAAFAALSTGAKDTFGYKPDLATAERKASVTKWKAWCEKQAGPMRGAGAKS